MMKDNKNNFSSIVRRNNSYIISNRRWKKTHLSKWLSEECINKQQDSILIYVLASSLLAKVLNIIKMYSYKNILRSEKSCYVEG